MLLPVVLISFFLLDWLEAEEQELLPDLVFAACLSRHCLWILFLVRSLSWQALRRTLSCLRSCLKFLTAECIDFFESKQSKLSCTCSISFLISCTVDSCSNKAKVADYRDLVFPLPLLCLLLRSVGDYFWVSTVLLLWPLFKVDLLS